MNRIEAVIGGMKMVRELTQEESAARIAELTDQLADAQRTAAQAVGRVRELEEERDAAKKAERDRCLAWANALRSGRLDDVRSVIYGIRSGGPLEDEEAT